MRACSELVDTWKASIRTHKRYPGIVHPLLTLPTQHRGNVFHVSPVPHSLGKVATCAADGYLRLLDVEVHSTSAGGKCLISSKLDCIVLIRSPVTYFLYFLILQVVIDPILLHRPHQILGIHLP